ncbi:MAG: hypothetical protein ACOX6N_04820 [Patescibacteria group bacterium]|jgi:hypothetical protein
MVEADLISKWNSLKGSEVVDRFRESMFPQDRLRRLDSSPHLVEYVVERVGPGIHSVDVWEDEHIEEQARFSFDGKNVSFRINLEEQFHQAIIDTSITNLETAIQEIIGRN